MASDEPIASKESTGEPIRFELGIAARGVLMGIAEIVPGVSGGTMAFITGIYARLIGALATFGPASFTMAARPIEFLRHHHVGFLASLGLGMILGVVIFAQIMKALITHYPPVVWAFFAGVILVSVFVLGASRPRHALLTWGPFGLLAGLALLFLPTTASSVGMFGIFLGGAVAVCAWILPAVSGSYMLLALGMYEQVLTALAEINLPVIATLIAGCAVGMLLFVRLLQWVLAHYEHALMSFLTGFMLGSVVKLWPWQLQGEARAHAEGLASLISPSGYAASGSEPLLLFAGVAFVLGGLGIWWLSRITRDE